MKNTTTWIAVSASLFGLLIGGSSAGIIGSYQYDSLKRDIQSDIAAIERKGEEQSAQIAVILVEIGKLQTMVQNLREKIDEKKR